MKDGIIDPLMPVSGVFPDLLIDIGLGEEHLSCDA